MKLTLQHVHVPSTDGLDRFLEERIISLEESLQIDEAKVRLECLWQASPPFLVRIHLITPGPDVMAENRDHTLRAAAEKALEELEHKIRNRQTRRMSRARSQAQHPARARYSRRSAVNANRS